MFYLNVWLERNPVFPAVWQPPCHGHASTSPLETGIKVDYLCDALQCNTTGLLSRLILEYRANPFRIDCTNLVK